MRLRRNTSVHDVGKSGQGKPLRKSSSDSALVAAQSGVPDEPGQPVWRLVSPPRLKLRLQVANVGLRSLGFVLSASLVEIPDRLCQTVPYADAILTIGFLYVIAQAVGLLWMLHLNVIGGCVLRGTKWVFRAASGHWGPESRGVLSGFLAFYTYYSTVRIMFLFGKSLWTLGWESFYGFPMLRGLLDAQVVGEEVALRALRRALLTPLTVLVSLLGFVLLVPTVCHVSKNPVLGSTSTARLCDESLLFSMWANAETRLHRMCLIAMLIGLMQCIQVWIVVFPRWHDVLLYRVCDVGDKWPRRRMQVLRMAVASALIMMPLSVYRIGFWLHPEPGKVLGAGFPMFDVAMVLTWAFILNIFGRAVICSPQDRRLAGFSNTGLTGGFAAGAARFRWCFLAMLLAYFLRGCLYPAHGWVFTQNDLIILTLAYPGVVVLAWWATCAADAVQYAMHQRGSRHGTAYWLLAMVLLAPLAHAVVCLAFGHRLWSNLDVACLAKTMVWVHMLRQLVVHAAAADSHPLRSFLTDRQMVWPHDFAAEARHVQQLGVAALKAAVAVLILFCLSLGLLSTVAAMQAYAAWLPSTISLTTTQVNDSSSAATGGGVLLTKVHHLISQLTLETPLDASGLPYAKVWSPPTGGVRYVACSTLWFGGLSLVDFALLSEAAYFDVGSPEMEAALSAFFPTRSASGLEALAVGVRNSSTLFSTSQDEANDRGPPETVWVEFDVPQLNLSVIAVRGTNPLRVQDYLEDIRMWTEPVALWLLGAVFPTVRIWPHETSSMVIEGIHDVLLLLELTEDPCPVTPLVQHLESLPVDRQVVLTGHSMGGGIAMIAAALSGRTSVAISPPGIYTSFSKHQRQHSRDVWAEGRAQGGSQAGLLAVHTRSMSVVVEGDWISKLFDQHGGLVQTVACAQPSLALHLGCHMLEMTTCHLLEQCGDERGRWRGCRFDYFRVEASWLEEHLEGVVQALLAWVAAVPDLRNLLLAALLVSSGFVLGQFAVDL